MSDKSRNITINEYLKQAIENCGYAGNFDNLLDYAKINVIEEHIKLIKNPRFIKPSSEELIATALLFNDGKYEEEKLGCMLAMCEFVVDRLYENGNIKKPSSKEINA